MLKNLLRGLVVLLLSTSVVWAAWNIKQKDDGTAAWESPVTLTETPIGEFMVTVDLTDLSSASTAFIASPITGLIQRVFLVTHAAITVATANVRILIAPAATSFAITPLFTTVTADGGIILISPTGDSFAVDGITGGIPAAAIGMRYAQEPTGDRSVDQGGVIAIMTDGGSTTTARATITVFIRPN